MAKLLEVQDHPGLYMFECPGCGYAHQVNTNPDYGITWKFNGNRDNPTVTPSILVRWTEGEEQVHQVCHSFIKNGNIEFLGDCTHHLAGQTVSLTDVPA